MNIGITVGDVRGPATLTEVIGQVQTAADAGFTTAWSAQALGWDALTVLAVAGAQVPGIGVGTAVVPVAQRHPLVLASQTLSVQAAVGGRFTLGIGAGIAMMVRSMFGLPTDRPARRMREYLSVLRPLLAGQSVTHHGETLTAVGAVDLPGATPPPVLLAALGPAMLRVAGQCADGTITWMAGPRTLADHIVPTIGAAAAASGRGMPRVVAGFLVCVTNDEAAMRDRVTGQFALAGQVPEYRAMFDREGAAGPGEVALIGDEDALARQLRRLADAGVTDLLASPVGSADEQARTTAVLADLARSTGPDAARGGDDPSLTPVVDPWRPDSSH
ncbi:TIGR03564 family F420-dependent LLM class oxidoreductase [Candidatus Frankia alpina]|uniref:TIGR03564 family F420-dependent LLM class oxidoreductase n=1 Tax=Candidatus Frankia alpina TaxID=2699483 RepID=UPI0013D5FE5D|nr:TIGR03564 family F420-dependent LLM class oxidoreductase [Candidatus Frankia alpina]